MFFFNIKTHSLAGTLWFIHYSFFILNWQTNCFSFINRIATTRSSVHSINGCLHWYLRLRFIHTRVFACKKLSVRCAFFCCCCCFYSENGMILSSIFYANLSPVAIAYHLHLERWAWRRTLFFLSFRKKKSICMKRNGNVHFLRWHQYQHHQQQAPNERKFLFFHHFHTQPSRKYAIYTDWDLRVGINFFLLKRSKIIIDFGAKNLWWKFVVRKRRKWREKKNARAFYYYL